MQPLAALRVTDVAAFVHRVAGGLAAHAPGIDQLDVVGSADADTGANLAATLAAIDAAVSAASPRHLAGLASAVHDAARGAVGRSGALVAAYLDAFADTTRNLDAVDATSLGVALESGATALEHVAGHGPMTDVGGRAAAAALEIADRGGALDAVAVAAADAALDALEATPLGSDDLADAGVVDAGAAGLVVVIEALVATVLGDEADDGELDAPGDDDAPALGRYRVALTLDADDASLERLVTVWRSLGEAVTLADPSGGVRRASVVTDDIGAVIEAALQAGRPRDITVDDRAGATRR